jgi:hypothetical protein
MPEDSKQDLVELTDAEVDAVAGGAPSGDPGYGVTTANPDGLYEHGATGTSTAVEERGLGLQGNIPGFEPGLGRRTAGDI